MEVEVWLLIFFRLQTPCKSRMNLTLILLVAVLPLKTDSLLTVKRIFSHRI